MAHSPGDAPAALMTRTEAPGLWNDRDDALRMWQVRTSGHADLGRLVFLCMAGESKTPNAPYAALNRLTEGARGHRGAPASDVDVRDTERRIGRKLPADLVGLYRHCNGFTVLTDEDDEGGFRLCPLADLVTYATLSGSDRRNGEGWLAPSDDDDDGWAHDPARVPVFDLGDGNHLSFTTTGSGRVVWIDDHREGPGVLEEAGVSAILTKAFDPSCVEDGVWISPFFAEEGTEEGTDDFAGSPPHFRAKVAMDQGKFEHALEIARAGRQGDKDFVVACDAIVLEALSRLARDADLGAEAARVAKAWASGKRGPIDPTTWRRAESAVAARLPDHAALSTLRDGRTKAESAGDFL